MKATRWPPAVIWGGGVDRLKVQRGQPPKVPGGEPGGSCGAERGGIVVGGEERDVVADQVVDLGPVDLQCPRKALALPSRVAGDSLEVDVEPDPRLAALVNGHGDTVSLGESLVHG